MCSILSPRQVVLNTLPISTMCSNVTKRFYCSHLPGWLRHGGSNKKPLNVISGLQLGSIFLLSVIDWLFSTFRPHFTCVSRMPRKKKGAKNWDIYVKNTFLSLFMNQTGRKTRNMNWRAINSMQWEFQWVKNVLLYKTRWFYTFFCNKARLF